MSDSIINDLPNEIIINILQYVDRINLRNAALTCKLWRDLIEYSCRWTLQLIKKNGYICDEQFTDFMSKTNRKFGTINFKKMRFALIDNSVVEMMHRHGCNVVKLNIRGCRIDCFITFTKLLKCMPNLEQLIMNETLSGRSVMPSTEDLPELKKLRSLQMIDSDANIVNCFSKANVETVRVWDNFYRRSLDYSPIVDFLSSQKMLKRLLIHLCYQHPITSVLWDIKNPQPFNNLTRLSAKSSLNDSELIFKLLKAQATTLRELELHKGLPDHLYEFVFANMPKLDTLSLILSEIPQDVDFCARLNENLNIKTLVLFSRSFTQNITLSSFFKKLPNIHHLTLGSADSKILLPVHGIQFPKLKTLRVKRLTVKTDWSKFTMLHPLLSNLTIDEIKDKRNESLFNSHDVDQITTNVSLRSLRIGQGFTADKRFFEIIRQNCNDLKVLDLYKRCVSDELRDSIDCTLIRWRNVIRESPRVTRKRRRLYWQY